MADTVNVSSVDKYLYFHHTYIQTEMHFSKRFLFLLWGHKLLLLPTSNWELFSVLAHLLQCPTALLSTAAREAISCCSVLT